MSLLTWTNFWILAQFRSNFRWKKISNKFLLARKSRPQISGDKHRKGGFKFLTFHVPHMGPIEWSTLEVNSRGHNNTSCSCDFEGARQRLMNFLTTYSVKHKTKCKRVAWTIKNRKFQSWSIFFVIWPFDVWIDFIPAIKICDIAVDKLEHRYHWPYQQRWKNSHKRTFIIFCYKLL